MGVGAGEYGCVDPNVCSCVAQTSAVQCVSGKCVYAFCTGIENDAQCRLPDGGTGWCCMGTCQSGPNGGGDDPNNCGGCGRTCPAQSACIGATACDPDCTKQPRSAGRACVGTSCVLPDCTGQLDEAPCGLHESGTPLSVYVGTCCDGRCVDATNDDANCGRCGSRCCLGTHRSGRECY